MFSEENTNKGENDILIIETAYRKTLYRLTMQDVPGLKQIQWRSQDLSKGVLEYVHKGCVQNFKPHPLVNRQGQVSNCQGERILNLSS